MGKSKKKLAYRETLPTQKILTREELFNQIPYQKCRPVFSFEYYDYDHPEFSAESIKTCKEFYRLIDELRKISVFTWGQMQSTQHTFHAHEVDWEKTAVPSGFRNRHGQEPQTYPAYQFKAYKEFRVFGFHRRGVFHIVWFDPSHKIYPRNG